MWMGRRLRQDVSDNAFCEGTAMLVLLLYDPNLYTNAYLVSFNPTHCVPFPEICCQLAGCDQKTIEFFGVIQELRRKYSISRGSKGKHAQFGQTAHFGRGAQRR